MNTPTHPFRYLTIEPSEEISSVVIVSLNRPNKRNAINAQMWKEIGLAFQLLGSGRYLKDCRCIILKGNGESFSGGIDISDPAFGSGSNSSDKADNDNDDDEEARIEEADVARKYFSFIPQIQQMQQCLSSLENKCTIPVIAAIHGYCIGAGVDLICCADIRLCSPNARFSIREVRIGLAADVGTLQRFPKIVGHGSRTRELCLTGEDFDPNEAERIGLVSRISKSNGSLINEVMEVAKRIAANSPVAVTGTKMSLVYSRDHSVKEGLDHIAMQSAAALMSDDLGLSLMGNKSKDTETFQNLLPHSRL